MGQFQKPSCFREVVLLGVEVVAFPRATTSVKLLASHLLLKGLHLGVRESFFFWLCWGMCKAEWFLSAAVLGLPSLGWRWVLYHAAEPRLHLSPRGAT